MKGIKNFFGGKKKGYSPGAQAPSGSTESLGYSVKEKDLSKIHKAAWTGDIAKVKQLAKKDSSSLDKENRTPLHLACAQGHANVAQELLEWNAKTNVGDNDSKTPLMKAVECGKEECVKLLLEYHADVDAFDGEGNTALHIAVKEGRVGMSKDIIQAGAKLDVRNKTGCTPLHFSVMNKKDELTRILLTNNADPNIADNTYRTPLHHACNEDAINHVKLLLHFKASTAMKDTKGWTAEDCAMMKGNHACSQLVYDHNMKQQTLSRSQPASTPRSGASSLPPSSHTTPRDKSASDFGMPQLPKEDPYDSDDPTISKGSVHEEKLDSWGDNTDVSSALDDHKEKLDDSDLDGDLFDEEEAPVKISLARNVNLDDSDEELKTGPSLSEGSRKSPGPRPGSGNVGGTDRIVYSRTPTPDGTASPINELDDSPAQRNGSGRSKIPIKQTLSGNSQTSVEDFTDDDDDDLQPIQRNRVSFKEEHDVRNMSTEDDTDADDDEEEEEEEVEPSKKRRIETPEEASGYLPPGVSKTAPSSNLSQDKIKEMMKDLGLDGDVSDLSDIEDSESYMSPRNNSQGSQPKKSILKPPKNDAGNPPSNQHPLDTDRCWDSDDDDEGAPAQASQLVVEAEINIAAVPSSDKDDDWDSTVASETENRARQVINNSNRVESPEYDSDLEGTLNPENSHVEKDHQTDEEVEDLDGHNTANDDDDDDDDDSDDDSDADGHDNESVQDLAGTGEINMLEIKELNESTDFSVHGSRSSSQGMDTPVAMTVIEEEKTEISTSDPKSDNTQKTQITVKMGSKTDSESGVIRIGDHVDSLDETIDKIEVSHHGNTDTGASKMSAISSDDVNSFSDKVVANVGPQKETPIEDKDKSFDDDEDDGHADDEYEAENMVKEEIEYFNNKEKPVKPGEDHEETSVKDEAEKSVSESKDRASVASVHSAHSADFKVMDRNKAPRCVFEYEPSTTEAESGMSDSDSLDTESLLEEVVEKKQKHKKSNSKSPKTVKTESMSVASDKEVARALAMESPSSFAKRQLAGSQDDFINRASVEPTTADTMDDQASLMEEEETSQWDSTEEAYTPRTPREEPLFEGQDGSLGIRELDYDEEDTQTEDQVNIAVTSFSTKTANQMTTFGRESPSSKSHDTKPSNQVAAFGRESPSMKSHASGKSHVSSGDTPTTSLSGAQKTVIAAEVMEPSPRDEAEEKDEGDHEEEDEESEWDSEDEDHSGSMDTPVIEVKDTPRTPQDTPRTPQETPRTPRGETLSSQMSDAESVSEWEIERQKQREQEIEQQKQEEEEERLRIENQRLAEEEERRQREEEAERQRLAEIAAEEEEQRKWEEQERKQLAELEEEEEQRKWEEQERKRLAELEEEEERQRQWEAEERRRQEELRREAEAELERERRSEDNVSDVSDFSEDDDENRFSFQQRLKQEELAQQQSEQLSERSERSRSRHSEVKVPSVRSDKDSPMAGLISPRVLELKRPPPKLVVSQFLTGPDSVRDSRHPVQIGEIENESPAPIYENLRHSEAIENESPDPIYETFEKANQDTADLLASPPPSNIITPPSENKYAIDRNMEAESDVGVEELDEDEVDDDLEDQIQHNLLDQHVEALRGPLQMSDPSPQFQSSFKSHNHHDDVLLGTPPPIPVSEPPGGGISAPTGTPGKAMSLRSDGNSADEDELDDLDLPGNNKLQGRTSLHFPPEISGTTGLYTSGLDVPFDDDGLSVTSTENGDISTSYRPESLPYGKDMLVNMNLSDSNAVLKLQEHLREHRRQLEHERGQKSLLENKQKLIVKEKAQMQKTIDSLKYQKSALEQGKLDLEAKIRNLEYSANEEEEKRKNAELLLKKTKEHLAKKEEQFTQEMEAKQRAELSMRNVQMELRSAQNSIREIEEEKAELERKLTNEKKGRELQEKINDEQQRLQQHMHEESIKTSSQREEAKSALELADDHIKYNKDLIDKYKNEAAALKAELQRQRQRLTDENSILSGEVEKLTQRIEDLKNEVKLNEEALTQYTLQNNLQQNKLIGETTMLGNSLDKERVTREKLEAELESARNRLQSTTIQLEKSQQARSDFERRLHSDREDWARQLERKDQELDSLKEKLQTVMHTLNATESKLNAVENELQISNTTLLERTNHSQQASRDLQYYKTAQENYDANFRHEKEQNAKLQAKVETLQERISGLQHDSLSLKQQLETAQNVANDRSGLNLQDKLNTMISNLKADHEKARNTLEEKNNTLQDTISRLREEVRNSENRRSNLEQDIRKLNQEQNDLIRKLSVAEASLEVATKSRDQLEQERLTLKMELEQLQQRYHSAQERTIEAQTRVSDLVSKLDQTEQSRQLGQQQLADSSATMHAFNTSKVTLEENYQQLKVDIVRLEAELKHEKQKTDMLNRDLQDSQKVRSSLEALCSNLKSTNAHLEEKLGPEQLREVTASNEVASRKLVVQDAEEHKGLWEQEVISRSKLGLRIAQLERHKQETATQLEEEKRKTRKALEQKRMVESKLENEQEKSTTLQKEVANLKAYLKVAKKKLKAMDTNETRVSHLHSAFDQERQAMEDMLVSVKSQLETMKIQLNDEMEEKEKVHQKNVQLENELKTIKKLERSVEKIDRSKRKLEQEFQAYKSNVEVGYMDKGSVEEAKKEIENRYRLELNRKLDEVNNYLEEQARTRHRLDTSRDEQDAKLRTEKRKLEEELTDTRIKYEQTLASKETKDLEAKRYRDLYESEMQWRMRLTEQLYSSTDKAFGLKNNAERQRNRMFGSLNNLSVNGHNLDISRINGSLGEDALSNKLRAELDRSIAKHLEAAPHDHIRPVIRADDPVLTTSNFAKANADYIEVLKRKYCV